MISVVMPAHNEEGFLEPAVKSVIAGLRDRNLEFEVIVAENGSVDATAREAEQIAQTFNEVVVVSLDSANYGEALRSGFCRAVGEIVIDFDVDLVDLLFLDQAVEMMASDDIAIVVGSKRSPGSEDRRGLARKLVTSVFSFVLRHGFGLRVSDTHGLKALRKAPLEPLVAECRFSQELFDTELILRAERAGLRVCEVPVTVADHRPPRTSIVSRIPRSILGLLRLRRALRKMG